VFIKGQAQFNEELAEFVGSEGARLYMESRYGADSEAYREMFSGDDDNRAYTAFIRELAAELEAVYASGENREEKLRKKEQIINTAKERFDTEYESRFSNDNYRGFSDLPLNNAYIDLYRLYYAEDNFYTDLYERSGRNLSVFIAAAKTITKKGTPDARSPRAQLAKALGLD
jgi:predicted aminopeptidase